MSVSVITAIFGNYDSLKDVAEQTINAKFVCVTDDPTLRSETWSIKLEPKAFAGKRHPRLLAKAPKFRPWRYVNSTQSIWVDGSAQIFGANFVADVLEALGDEPIAQFRHPWRDCIYDEGEVSKSMLKYQDLPIDSQLNYYRKQGHPEHWGLWAAGLIARNHGPEIEKFGNLWLTENETWTYQDQLSEPYLLRQLGMRPVDLPHPFESNPWLSFLPHWSEA